MLITTLELRLLLKDNLEGFSLIDEEIFIEKGKGADSFFSQKVKDISNDKILNLVYIHNSDVGFQEYCCGDFELSYDKKDIYNEKGELKTSNKNLNNEKELNLFETHEKMVKDGIISNDIHNDQWVEILDLETLLYLTEESKKTKKNLSNQSINDLQNIFLELAIKNKFNVHTLFYHIFNKPSTCIKSKKELILFFEELREERKRKANA